MQQCESENARFFYFYVDSTGVYCMNALLTSVTDAIKLQKLELY